MATGTRLEEVRGLEALARRAYVDALILTLFASNNPSAIDPDDAAAIGSAPRFAREDHQHAITAGTPAALTLTATSAESAGTGFARDAHVHSTAALPWGEMAREVLTANSSGLTASGATDLNVSVTADTTRLYEVHVLSTWTVTVATGRWLFTLTDDATKFARVGDTQNVAANVSDVLHTTALWLPSTGGSHSVELRVEEAVDGSTLTLNASATEPRMLWVTDVGPR